MKRIPERTQQEAANQQTREFFSGGTFSWTKSQQKVWSELEQVIRQKPKGRAKSLPITRWSIAATLLILIGVGFFLRFYTITENSPAGVHRKIGLPDGSVVEINASTTLQYNPYWWFVSRKLSLSGEAFFEVVKGKKFSVRSSSGKTEVIGTSFNIFSRDEIYKVTCISGKVKVTSFSGFETVLLPQNKAEILGDGEIKTTVIPDTYPYVSWRNNEFIFTAWPVDHVLSEIERQYNIRIEHRLSNIPLYSGNFHRGQNVEDVLSYICPALDLKFIRKTTGVYAIIELSE